jgi:hypothetical protein
MRDPSGVRVTGPLERYARGFRVELDRRGYAPASAAQRMQLMACVSRWMAAERVAVSGLTCERLEGFVRGGGRPAMRTSHRHGAWRRCWTICGRWVRRLTGCWSRRRMVRSMCWWSATGRICWASGGWLRGRCVITSGSRGCSWRRSRRPGASVNDHENSPVVIAKIPHLVEKTIL